MPVSSPIEFISTKMALYILLTAIKSIIIISLRKIDLTWLVKKHNLVEFAKKTSKTSYVDRFLMGLYSSSKSSVRERRFMLFDKKASSSIVFVVGKNKMGDFH